MVNRRKITFDAFTLDITEELLWKGIEKIHLRPKTFALFQHLITHSGQLVTKNELLNAVWRDCNVGEEALKHCMVEIRKALGDDAEKPRFIETVHRRGYRFIGQPLAPRRKEKPKKHSDGIQKVVSPDPSPFVGRETELAQLKRHLEEAIKGSRQVVFISGEQGIGKTSLVDAFLDTVASSTITSRHFRKNPVPWITRGQCIQSHGKSEAYMPLLEALMGLCHTSEGGKVINYLCRYAPLWMSQMPSQLSADQMLRIRISTSNATRERMLRELAEALEELTKIMPLILVLEDLHWSDPSTLDWISCWSQRRGSSRMLLLATYRTAEVTTSDHPFENIQRELRLKQLYSELELPSLEESVIGEYLKQRFPSHGFPAGMTHWVQQRTDGNPLFIVNLLNHLSEQGLVVKRNKRWTLDTSLEKIELTVPPSIRQIVDQQIERSTLREQQLLQAASVKGMEFSVAGLAAALNEKADDIEMLCGNLAGHNQFLEHAPSRTLLKGKTVACFRFIHAFYRDVCYQFTPSERRALLHLRIASFIEREDNRPQEELYAQLAMHFDRGREYKRAIRYYQKAVDNANSRYAGHEALELATRGLQLLDFIPDAPERLEHEVRLQNALGTALISVEGLGDERAEKAFRRAKELFRKMSAPMRSRGKTLLFQSLYGLWSYYWVNAEFLTARKLAEQLVDLAKTSKDPHLRAQSHYALGIILMDHGEYASALGHLQKGSGVICGCCAEIARWHVGYPDKALNTIQEIFTHALETQNIESILFAHLGTARVNMARGEYEQAKEHAQAAMDISLCQGMSEPWLTPMRIIHGWGEAKTGKRNAGLRQVRKALAVFHNIQASNLKPLLFALYADILMEASQIEEALSVVEEALEASQNTRMHHFDAELFRLKGELLLQRPMIVHDISDRENPQVREAENYFRQAEETARYQQAKSLELRAATSLARLWLKQERRAEAIKHLTNIHDWFTEGHETVDLKSARQLLEELSK